MLMTVNGYQMSTHQNKTYIFVNIHEDWPEKIFHLQSVFWTCLTHQEIACCIMIIILHNIWCLMCFTSVPDFNICFYYSLCIFYVQSFSWIRVMWWYISFFVHMCIQNSSICLHWICACDLHLLWPCQVETRSNRSHCR